MNALLSLSFLILSLMMTTSLSAQDLAAHRWQNRLVILLADDRHSPLIQEQLAVFQEEAEGMQERKLVVYRVSPTTWEQGLAQRSASRVRSPQTVYQRFNPTGAAFQFILIGLDGGVKWRVQEVVSCEDLFARIDGMPMRRAELRGKSGGN